MHHGVTGEPCRIVLVLIYAKDDSVLEAEEVHFAPRLSIFLWIFDFFIHGNRKTEER